MHIKTVKLPSGDLQANAEYYGGVLELPVHVTDAMVTVDAGSTRIHFEGGEAPAGAHHLAFTIPRNHLAEAKRWLSARTELLVLDGQDQFRLEDPWDSESVYFKGPEGMVLELIARDRLNNQASAAFTSSHILGVSEVGLAVPDVPQAVREIRRTLGIPSFAGDTETFHAVGDQEGLLILVTENRPWFPTKDAASSAGYLEVELTATPRSGTVTSTAGWRVVSPGPAWR